MRKIVTAKERHAFLQELSVLHCSVMTSAVCNLAIGCSMRIGEILVLTWDCVHMDPELMEKQESYLVVNKSLRRSEKKALEQLQDSGRTIIYFTFPAYKKNCTTSLVLAPPKTQNSNRRIYIPNTIVSELKALQQEQMQLKAELGDAYTDFNLIIAQSNGRPYEEKRICELFHAFIAENKLSPVVFHSLRHTSTCIKLHSSGGDVKSVQGDTGHAQAKMVTDVYAHTMDQNRKELAIKMDDLFTRNLTAETKKAAAAPTDNSSVGQLMQLLESKPELSDALLKLAEALGS